MKRRFIYYHTTLIFLLMGAAFSASADDSILVFTNTRIIDGTGKAPIEEGALEIQNGRIIAVGKIDPAAYANRKDVKIIPCDGRTIMPSLISNHSHVGIVKDGKVSSDNYTPENIKAALIQYERYGVTSVLALGMNKDLLYDLREQQRAGKFGGAEILTADRGLGVASAAPPVVLGTDQVTRPASPEEARRIVDEMAARHPDIIKCWVDDFFGTVFPKMPPEIYAAIIDEAHKKNLRVAAHLFHLEDAKSLVRDGLDVIAHSVRDLPVDQELIDLMKSHHTAYIATLALDESQFVYADHPAWMDSPAFKAAVDPALREKWLGKEYAAQIKGSLLTPKNRAALAQGMKNIKTVYDAGLLVGFGTDSGANPYRIPGWAEHRELQLMVEAGLTPMQAIQCATHNAAELDQDLQNRGTLEPGKRADFLILAANPLDNIRNTTRLVAIYHGGNRVEPAYDEKEQATALGTAQ
jgi:imidazolonepropionase-like amidohydrolase